MKVKMQSNLKSKIQIAIKSIFCAISNTTVLSESQVASIVLQQLSTLKAKLQSNLFCVQPVVQLSFQVESLVAIKSFLCASFNTVVLSEDRVVIKSFFFLATTYSIVNPL